MPAYYKIQSNKDLTDQAKEIFGGIVANVYVVVIEYDSPKVTQRTLTKLGDYTAIVVSNVEEDLHFLETADESMLLEFTNGKVVELSCTGATSFCNVNLSEMTII